MKQLFQGQGDAGDDDLRYIPPPGTTNWVAKTPPAQRNERGSATREWEDRRNDGLAAQQEDERQAPPRSHEEPRARRQPDYDDEEEEDEEYDDEEEEGEPPPQRQRARRRGWADTYIDDSAPLPRPIVDRVLPLLRLIGSAVFIGYSARATIIHLAQDISPITRQRDGGSNPEVIEQIVVTMLPYLNQPLYLNILISFIVAVAVVILECTLSERATWWYRLVLAFDAVYTTREARPQIVQPLVEGYLPRPEDWVGQLAWDLLVSLLSFLLGAAIAYLGEILLMGRRRKRKK